MSSVRHIDEAPTGTSVGLDEELRSLAARRAGERLSALLDRLGAQGFSWQDVARAVGVSVSQLRKWRRGESATGDSRQRVARSVALCEIAAERCRIADVAGWLETPLCNEAPISGLDLVAAGRFDLVLSLAQDQLDGPKLVLDEFDPDWRARYLSDVEVFTAADGMSGLRLAGSDDAAASLAGRSA